MMSVLKIQTTMRLKPVTYAKLKKIALMIIVLFQI